MQAREALVDALARDAYAILAALDGRTLASEVTQAAKLVATVVGQDLEQRDDGMFRIARRVAKDRVISTVDPVAVVDMANVEDRLAEPGDYLDHSTIAGTSFSVGDLPASPPRTIHVGLVELTMTRVAAPPRTLPLATHGDRRVASYIGVSLAAHLLLWGIAPSYSEPTPVHLTERVLHPRLVPSQPPAPVLAFESGDSPDDATTGGGSPTVERAGKAGGESKNETGHIQIAKRAEAQQVSREVAIEQARSAGILGNIDSHAAGIAAIVGKADFSSGFDKLDVQGPLFGGTGEANGTFGLSRSGTFDGAGCNGPECNGIIGVGRYGTLSNGQTIGQGWGGRGGGADSMRQRRTFTMNVFPCAGPRPCWVDKGGLDKAIVHRYIKRNLTKIQYCYEKELLAQPELTGTVETDFLIAPDGKVQTAAATGTNDNVSRCVADVIRGIEFPRSQDGSTQVKYPFTFRWSGS